MPYGPVEDIPGIETSRVNIKKLDPFLYSAIESTRFALRHRYNFKKRTDQESELITILRIQLSLYSITHRSIRILLRRAYRDNDKTLIGDAASLVREQIEKIFTIALILDNPVKWMRQYLRSSWRTEYMEFLLESEEHGSNPRYEEHLKERYPEHLKRGQRPPVPGRKTETVVSDFAKRTMKYNWDNPSGPEPQWFRKVMSKIKNPRKRSQRVRDYVRNYFEFPTPGRAAGIIKDMDLRQFLFRWHKEYSHVCQYSHVALGKMILPVMSEFKDIEHAEKVKIYGQLIATRVLFTSHTAAATACALVVHALINTCGAKSEVEEYWKELYERSLPSKALWNMYIKDLLA
ncbi:MAG: hypothetical protein H7Z38_15615 [Rubrivivax sp.]|nr:hypothetical protein [Pyrinomonadaceae bacterium]